MFSRCLPLLLLAASVSAGEFNQVLSVGDAAPVWNSLPGTDGKSHSASEIAADRFVVVVFTCNSCPVARDYEDRIMEFARRYAEQVSVVAINVNTVPDDRLDRMRARATERKFNFTYLYDETQKIAKAFGATGTPEFFLLSRATGDGAAAQRKVLYMGSMDDHSRPDMVTKHLLDDALQAALRGELASVGETYAHGCRIRFARERRN